MRIFFIFLFSLFVTRFIYAQQTKKYEPPDTRILFIFDASQSMAGFWEHDRKIAIAQKTLVHIIDSLETLDNIQMALRIYGHQSPVPPQDCDDTKLEVPFGKNNASRIRQKLLYINPKGTTPIAHSLEMGGEDFPPDCDNCRNIIILITDGIEACDGDPCQVSLDLQRKGIVLKPFVIGIGIDDGFKETFDCIGHYYNAVNEEKFKEVMEVVITQALNSTTAQVNLLDVKGHPTETNVNLSFSDQFSGKIRYNYIHTMNHRGNPDTLILDHLSVYNLKVHTIPPVEKDSIKLIVAKHNIIAVDAPQGTLIVTAKGGHNYRGMEYILRQSGSLKTLHTQEMYEAEKYLVGKYDIEIPTLPRTNLYGIEVNQSTETKVEIARPGLVTLLKPSAGFGSIYYRKTTIKEEWVCNINNANKNETIVLQPGKYRVVYRAQNAKQTIYTVNKTFKIVSGSSVVVNLY
jgi:Ca-activated chloride channel family protein